MAAREYDDQSNATKTSAQRTDSAGNGPALIGLIGLVLAVGGIAVWATTEEPGRDLVFLRVLDPAVVIAGGFGLIVAAMILAELRRVRALLDESLRLLGKITADSDTNPERANDSDNAGQPDDTEPPPPTWTG